MEEDNRDKGSRPAVTVESRTLDRAYGARMCATSVGSQDICQGIAETREYSDSK